MSTSLFFHSCMFSSFPSVSLAYLPLCLPCGDICCCLHGTLARSQTNSPSSLLRTRLENCSTSVYRPIGALVCKPRKGQDAQLRNVTFYFICDNCTCCVERDAEPRWHAMSTQLQQRHRHYSRWCLFHFSVAAAWMVQSGSSLSV